MEGRGKGERKTVKRKKMEEKLFIWHGSAV